MKYSVTVVRIGYVDVEADSAEEAMRDVNENAKLDEVNWCDDWNATDAIKA